MSTYRPQTASFDVTTESPHEDLAAVLGALSDGVIVLDRDWRFTYANEAGRQLSRIKPEDLHGPTHWELYPATVGTEQERVYRRSMAERISLEHEFYYPPFEIWVSLRTIPVPGGIAVHYRDITRLKNAEADRAESAQRLQQVFEATTDAVVMLDHDYRFTFVNRRARELLAPSGELLGRSLWDVYPAALYEGSPFVDVYGKTMKDGTPGKFEAHYAEPLNLWVAVESRKADDGIIVFFHDITEEKAAAEELRLKTVEAERQAAEIETVYRTAPIGLALFDTEEFRYLRLNDRQAAFYGLKPEEVVGRPVTDMAVIPGLLELFRQVRAGTPVVNHLLEGELTTQPGEYRYWTVNYFPLYGASGSIVAIAAASLEITAQKRAEKALIESEKLAAVGRLAASISHEINNPLESVTNLLYLVETSEELAPALKTYVALAQSEIARVSEIATQTLRFHRQTTQRTRVSAEELVLPVVNLYQGRLTNSGIVVDLRFDTERTVWCYENEMRQVINNLIGNAIDAMRGGGTLRLGASLAMNADGVEGVAITVEDTGHGMSAVVRERIFEPFFTTKELNGTGLGLWISADIVKRHKGTLTVESREDAVGHGTVFRLWLAAA
jgi:PAS domain S-box-containing protein